MAWAAAIPAAVGSVATLAQSLFGGNAEMQAAMLQYKLQKQIADQQYELATAGQTNARGDKTQYIPGRGFVATPSDSTRGLIGASDREERQRLTEDMMRSRIGRERNFNRRGSEGALADTLLAKLTGNVGQVTPEQVTGALVESGAANLNDKADFAKNSIAAQGIRSGMSSGSAIDDINKASRSGLRGLLMDARVQGPKEATAQNAATTQSQLAPYNTLAARASNIDDIPFAPDTKSDTLAATLLNQRNISQNGLNGASMALTRGLTGMGDAINKSKPNFGAAVGSFGSLLQQLLADKSKNASQTGFDSEHTLAF